jgi:apolipoprotein N-acyltransferase
MASKPKSSNPEQGPERELEDAARFEANLEYVKQSAGAWVERLMEDLDLPEEDVYQLAVVVFGRYLDLTNSPDKVVLVVQGEVTPYDNALQALIADDREQDFYTALIGRLQEGNPRTGK